MKKVDWKLLLHQLGYVLSRFSVVMFILGMICAAGALGAWLVVEFYF